MLKQILVLSFLLLVSSTVAWAQSTPPEYVLEKQLPGQDPFSISRPTFAPDGQHVAAFVHSTRTLTVWNVKTGKLVADIPESVHKFDAVDSLDFSVNGKNLLMIRKDLPLIYVEWATGKVVKEVAIKGNPKKVYVSAFSPQQDLVAIGTDTGVAVWDLKAGKRLASYLKDVPISGLDIIYRTDPKTKKVVRLLGFAKALVPPDLKFKDIAGLIDLDTGKITYLLNDVPADQKVDGRMTFTTFSFESGGSHALVTTMVLPPFLKVRAYLIDTSTSQWKDYLELGQKTVAERIQYLGKPYNGFVVSTSDMSNPESDYQVSTQFLTASKGALKIVDTVDQSKIAVQSIAIHPQTGYAAITTKKNGSEPAKIFLYKLKPKTP